MNCTDVRVACTALSLHCLFCLAPDFEGLQGGSRGRACSLSFSAQHHGQYVAMTISSQPRFLDVLTCCLPCARFRGCSQHMSLPRGPGTLRFRLLPPFGYPCASRFCQDSYVRIGAFNFGCLATPGVQSPGLSLALMVRVLPIPQDTESSVTISSLVDFLAWFLGSCISLLWFEQQAATMLFSVMLSIFLALLDMLFVQMAFSRSPGGRVLRLCTAWVRPRALIPLGNIAQVDRCDTRAPQVKKQRPHKRSAGPRPRVASSGFWGAFWMFLFGLLRVPTPVYAMASLQVSTWETDTSEIAAPSDPVDTPPVFDPLRLLEQQLELEWPPRYSATGHNSAVIGTAKARRLVWPVTANSAVQVASELGVIVHSPHRQATHWAFQVDRSAGSTRLLSDILDLGDALYSGLYDSVVPISPQRHPGYAMVMVFSSVLAHCGATGHIPIIIDLSRVGGHYFPTVLPHGITFEQFEAFVRPLTWSHVEDLFIYIGRSPVLFRPGMCADMQAGEVFTVLMQAEPWDALPSFEDLFEPDAAWGPIEHIPRNLTTPAFSVTHDGHRYLLFQADYPHSTVAAAVCSLLRLDSQSVSLHACEGVADLDVQGTACAGVIMVEPLPRQGPDTPPRLFRRDVFVLNDLRVLGQKPFPFYTHSLEVHVPSILARAHCCLPDSYDITVRGGSLEWPDIRFESSATLVYGMELRADSQAFDSDDPSEPDDDDDDDSHPDEGPADDDSTTAPEPDDAALPDHDTDGDTGQRPRSRSPPGIHHAHRFVATLCQDQSCLSTAGCFSHVQSWFSGSPCFQGLSWLLCAVSFPSKNHNCKSGPVQHKGPDQPGLYTLVTSQEARAQLHDRLANTPVTERDAAHGNPPDFRRPSPELLQEQIGPDPWIYALFVIHAPGYLPEEVRVVLPAPCAVLQALDEVDEERSEEPRHRFPNLVEVSPQPSREYGTLLALPSWLHRQTVIFFDCRYYNNTVFSATVASVLRREDLLVVAGIGSGAQVAVFLGGDPRALRAQQVVHLSTGDAITIATLGTILGTGVSLAAMLLSNAGWDDEAQQPGRQDQGFWVMTDTVPERFALENFQRLRFRQDLAAYLSWPLAAMTVRPTVPRIRDHQDNGWPSSAVLVATRQITRPTRRPPRQFIVVFDLRPVLNGLEWCLFDTPYVARSDLLERFTVDCPLDWEVSITGPPLHHQSGEACFLVEDGQVLTVEYKLTDQATSRGSRSSDEDVDDSASETEADATDSGDSSPDTTARPPRSADRRSRSPREGHDRPARTHGRGQRPNPKPVGWFSCGFGLRMWLVAALSRPLAAMPTNCASFHSGYQSASVAVSRVNMWPSGPKQRARSTGHPEITSVRSATICQQRKGHSRSAPHTSETCGRRTIPTPCRNLKAQPAHAVVAPVLASGCTLLEEAARSPKCTAFFEARALLETLLEHFAGEAQEDQPCHTVTPPRAVVSQHHLRLETAVPPTPFQQQVQALAQHIPDPPQATPCDMPGQDWLDNDLSHLSRDAHVPAHWRRLFRLIPVWHGVQPLPKPTAIYIYTDGSASSRPNDISPAAWAITVWFQTPEALLFVGGSAHTTAPADSPYHVGECSETALTGELLALCWGAVWALEYGAPYRVPIEFRYDATSAGGGVFGSCQCPASAETSHGPSLGAFAIQVRQCLEARCTVLHTHVKGHSGHLGNELCDQLSKYCRRHPSPPRDRLLPEWPHAWWSHPLWEWGWLIKHSSPSYPCLGAFEAEASRLQSQTFCPKVPTMGTQVQRYRRAEVAYHITATTYNVLTLFDPHAPKGRAVRQRSAGLLTMGKRDVLKRQFLAAGIWLVGLQETRLPDTATLPDKDFWMFSSGATVQGGGGCAVWINKHFAYAQEAKIRHTVSLEHVVMTSCSARHIQVHIETPRLSLTILVAHAPKILDHDESVVKSFWRERAQDLAKRPARADYIILADANSHMGSVETAAVGPHGAESENREGQLFHSFLLGLGGFLPATHAMYHTGVHWTWCSPGPSPVRHRLDYVILPQTWCNMHINTWVWQDFEALQARMDHLPSCLRVSFAKSAPPREYATGRRQAVRPPRSLPSSIRVSFGLQVSSMQPTAWEADVDEHYDAWVANMRALAEGLCEPPSKQPTNPYLTPATLNIVAQRSAIRQYLRLEDQERRRRLQMIVFGAFLLHTRGQVFTPPPPPYPSEGNDPSSA